MAKKKHPHGAKHHAAGSKSSHRRRGYARRANPASDLVGVALGAAGGVVGDYALISFAKLDPKTAGMVEAVAGVGLAAFMGTNPMIRNAGIGLASIGGVRLLSSWLTASAAAPVKTSSAPRMTAKTIKGLGEFYQPTISASDDLGAMPGDAADLGAMLVPTISAGDDLAGELDGVELAGVELGGVELGDMDGVELAEIDGIADAYV